MSRRVLAQRQVRPQSVVVGRIGLENFAQVVLTHDHHVIQALATDRADETFDVSVLPGRPRRRWSVADTDGRKTPGYGMTVRGVPVADQVLRRLFPRESLGDLLS